VDGAGVGVLVLACGTMREELELWRGLEGLYWLGGFGLVLFPWLVPLCEEN